jgi:pimeloyl-ACP methyl ester carboxylesterase
MRTRVPLPSLVVCGLLILAAALSAQGTVTSGPIHEDAFVMLGGIEQWITIHGDDGANPVILVLHGGPGVSNAPFAPAFARWRDKFTVVEWDQRGAGRTFGRNGVAGSGVLSIDRLSRDGIELAGYLREHLHKDKIVLFGISFGSMLGINMVEMHPELFAAYVGAGQFINAADGDRIGYELTLNQARAVHNADAIKALEDMGPPPWKDVRTRSSAKGWAMRMTKDGDPAGSINIPALLRALPDFNDSDLKNLAAGMAFSTDPLTRDGAAFDARVFGSRFPLPLFVFQGADDFNTPTELVQRWFDTLDAPHKQMVVVEHASHGAFFTHADQLGELLSERIRPLALH